ncbi:FAD-dependent oxidoreductase, partial [Ralstonia pseudosolanacearum]|uniref:FAD-dependent oxidoreductase n=1 Tax=Ralstonia pseudosolanacearum TaxID=1310165 RepID=UPI003CF691F3
MTQPSIAIVGAGIAGVACANALAAEGISATVYERGGGVGGRLATRVLPEGAPTHAFDHGAQSFNVRTEAFRRAVAVREFALDQLAAAELHTHVALRP